jgi:hypothetical protein
MTRRMTSFQNGEKAQKTCHVGTDVRCTTMPVWCAKCCRGATASARAWRSHANTTVRLGMQARRHAPSTIGMPQLRAARRCDSLQHRQRWVRMKLPHTKGVQYTHDGCVLRSGGGAVEPDARWHVLIWVAPAEPRAAAYFAHAGPYATRAAAVAAARAVRAAEDEDRFVRVIAGVGAPTREQWEGAEEIEPVSADESRHPSSHTRIGHSKNSQNSP